MSDREGYVIECIKTEHNYITLGYEGIPWRVPLLFMREMLLEAFKRLGYDVVYAYICKSCLTNIGPGCCMHYSHTNRSKRYVIKNIVCVETKHDDI